VRKVARGIIALLSAGCLAVPTSAYDYPLSNQAVREGYFLGQRRDESTAKFLARYVKRLPATKYPWQVAEVEVRTPYHQVVLRSRQSLPGYSAQQAWEEYRKRKPLIVVRVYMVAPVTQVIVNENVWQQFRFHAAQEKEIHPSAVVGWPVYSIAGGGGSTIVGAEVHLELDAAQVLSTPLRVEVKSPEGRVTTAEFDLSRLR